MPNEPEALRRLGAALLEVYKDTEARAAAHPRQWLRVPSYLRDALGKLVEEIEPGVRPCPCRSCRSAE